MNIHFTLIVLLVFLPLYAQTSGGQLNQDAELRGQVSDLFGQPIAGVLVEASLEKSDRLFKEKSDSKGWYRFSKLKSGRYTVAVSYQGFRREERTIILKDSESYMQNWGLEPGSLHDPYPTQVDGIVTLPTQRPQENITVSIVNMFNNRLSDITTTNAKGEYKLSVNNPGQYLVYATNSGYPATVATITLSATLPRVNKRLDLILNDK
jgi:carboxypeptidase family protein